MLLLDYQVELVPEGGSVLACQLAGPIQCGKRDAAGLAFHTKVLIQQGLVKVNKCPSKEDLADAVDEASSNTKQSVLQDDQPPDDVKWKGSKKKRNVKKKDGDLYALLGLQNERWTANENQIKNAYRRTCLEHHPDKRMAGVTDEAEKQRIEDHFKLIQEAYETLSDPAKRREFDSTDDFDDTLPTDCAPVDFFKVFGPAFRRQARWSVNTAVPDVGSESTPYAEVSKFYDFWYGFRSWREFPHPDEEDVEGAESREHRRWIERINSKLREKAKKEEGRRLRDFVDTAYRLDPRVTRKKEEDKLERERKKAEKEAARRRVQEEEEAKKAEAEAAKKAAEAAVKQQAEAAKKVREQTKKALKKERARLRGIVAATDSDPALVAEEEMEELLTKLDTEALAALCQRVEVLTCRDERAELLRERLGQLEGAAAAALRHKELQRQQAEAALRDFQRRDHAKKVEKMSEWNDEELRMLDKAVAKFPQGTPKRWEQVSAYIRTRTLDEVLMMVKERQGASGARLRAQEDWRGAQKRPADLKNATLDSRSAAFTDVEVRLVGQAAVTLTAGQHNPSAQGTPAGPTAASAVGPAAESAAGPPAGSAAPTGATAGSVVGSVVGSGTTAAAVVGASAAPKGKGGKAKGAAAKASGGPEVVAAVEVVAAAAGGGVQAAPAENGVQAEAGGSGAGAKVVSAESGEWSAEQELALVTALKRWGKELPDRWERIAAEVPGKGKAACFKRFKELRDVFRNRKGAAAAE